MQEEPQTTQHDPAVRESAGADRADTARHETHHDTLKSTHPSTSKPAPQTAAGVSPLYLSALSLERLGLKRLLLAIGAVSLCTNLILALTLLIYHPSAQTIVVPPTLIDEKEAWTFTSHGPSANYLARYAASLTNMLTTATPASVDHQREEILRVTAPTLFSTLEADLLNEATRMKKNRMSTVFTPMRVTVDESSLAVALDGELVVIMGDTVARREMKRFALGFQYQAGRLMLASVEGRKLSEAERHSLTEERKATSVH